MIKIEEYIEKKREQVDYALEGIIPDGNEAEKAARYVLLAKGHRWRPILALTLAEEFGNSFENLDKLSCVGECMHAASIILDDLPCMDDADLRRGRETCHLKYGEDIASLAAIRLVNAAWHTINTYSPREFRKIFLTEGNEIGNRLIDGQISDLKNIAKSEEEILLRYTDKSGRLFSLAVLAGLFHSDWKIEKMYEFGNAIGVAYQIADDLQDALLDEKEIGKDVGKDSNKITIISLVGIDEARKMAKEYKEKVMGFVKGKEILKKLLDRIIRIN